MENQVSPTQEGLEPGADLLYGIVRLEPRRLVKGDRGDQSLLESPELDTGEVCLGNIKNKSPGLRHVVNDRQGGKENR